MSHVHALDPAHLPAPTQEAWKYTNLPKAVPTNLKPVEAETIVIHKTRGQNGGKPEEILLTGRDGILHTPVFSIIIEDGVEATIIERHDGTGSYWKNMVTHISLGQNAKLHHYRELKDSDQAVHTNMVHVTIARDATYDSFTLNNGGKMLRHQIHAELNGPNIECSFNGINLLNGSQHGDTTILMEHKAPHCKSNQFYRHILDGKARGVFQGKVHVHQAAQKTDGYQLSNALILSPEAEMDTKPELEIYADDVKCSHGATTGQLDEEPLFYLRSRGLSAAEARMLLVQAFVDEVADKVVDENFQTSVKESCAQWLLNALSK
jgi:Fe-S cluster assembly protein SufD